MALKRIEDGGRIAAVWHGRAITGVVESSRVKYGGTLQYFVKLDTPVVRFMDGFREDREYALVSQDDVVDINDRVA
jgi:hypothetical protein